MQSRYVIPATLISVGCILGSMLASAQEKLASTERVTNLDRTVLPPLAPDFKGKIGPNYKQSTPDFSPGVP